MSKWKKKKNQKAAIVKIKQTREYYYSENSRREAQKEETRRQPNASLFCSFGSWSEANKMDGQTAAFRPQGNK